MSDGHGTKEHPLYFFDGVGNLVVEDDAGARVVMPQDHGDEDQRRLMLLGVTHSWGHCGQSDDWDQR